MKRKPKALPRKKYEQVLFILGMILISFNLRPAITAVGPLISSIRTSTGISTTSFGLLTTLPILAFGVFSIVAPKLGRRFGNEITVFAALFILTIGILIRSAGSVAFLYIGTTLLGLGIAICNVLIIGIIKERMPHKIGLMTGLYTTSMSLMAALASGMSVPLAVNLQLGWGKTLAFWAVLSAITLGVWLPQVRFRKNSIQKEKAVRSPLWKSALAWQVTLFMGFQSSIFYCVIAWFPEILVSRGIDLLTAGLLLTFMQLMGLPGNFLIPILAVRLKSQKPIVLGITSVYILGFAAVYFSHNLIIVALSMMLIGLAQGAGISLALTLFGLRTKTAIDATGLSGMAQSGGYLLASAGPIFMGLLFDLYHTWVPALMLFGIFIAAFAAFGMLASRDIYIDEGESLNEQTASSTI